MKTTTRITVEVSPEEIETLIREWLEKKYPDSPMQITWDVREEPQRVIGGGPLDRLPPIVFLKGAIVQVTQEYDKGS